MNKNLARAIASLLTDSAVLMRPAAATALFRRLIDVPNDGPSASAPHAGRLGAGGGGDYPVVPQSAAYLQLCGVLTKYPTFYDDFCGLCPTAPLLGQLADAVADPATTTILLDVDSPGGYVNGAVEFADMVAAANQVKPVVAIVRGQCCSGAYWIASQCGRIIARPESECANIGVYSVLADMSKFYDSIGVSLTTISSAPLKGLGSDGRVTDEFKADTQRIIDGLSQQFQEAVSRGRTMNAARVSKIADGRSWLGPESMLLGVVDEIASSFETAVASAMQVKSNGRGGIVQSPEAAAAVEWRANAGGVRDRYVDEAVFTAVRRRELAAFAADDEPAASLSIAEADKRARQEWLLNAGDCRRAYATEDIYIRVRRRELGAQ